MELKELRDELSKLKMQLILMKNSEDEVNKIEQRIEQIKKQYSKKVHEEIEKERGKQK